MGVVLDCFVCRTCLLGSVGSPRRGRKREGQEGRVAGRKGRRGKSPRTLDRAGKARGRVNALEGVRMARGNGTGFRAHCLVEKEMKRALVVKALRPGACGSCRLLRKRRNLILSLRTETAGHGTTEALPSLSLPCARTPAGTGAMPLLHQNPGHAGVRAVCVGCCKRACALDRVVTHPA